MLLFGSINEFRLFTFGFYWFVFGFGGLLIRFCRFFYFVDSCFVVALIHSEWKTSGTVSCKAGFRLGFHHFYFAGISF